MNIRPDNTINNMNVKELNNFITEEVNHSLTSLFEKIFHLNF